MISFRIRTVGTFTVVFLLIAGIVFLCHSLITAYGRVVRGALELQAGHVIVVLIWVFGVFCFAWMAFGISKAWWQEYRGRDKKPNRDTTQ